MRDVPQSMWNTWLGGDYTGDSKRPMCRVTIQIPVVSTWQTRVSRWRSTFLTIDQADGGLQNPRELPNLKSFKFTRDLTQPVATATFVFYNQAPIQQQPTQVGGGNGNPVTYQNGQNELDSPGYYTYNRGYDGVYWSRWGYPQNEWYGMLVPDRVLRTYQGYGWDPNSIPELDPNLVQTGEWWIDEVDYSATSGLIIVQCRDRAGPGLVDQVTFPPVVPLADYPVYASAKISSSSGAPVPSQPSVKYTTQPVVWESDSNFPYVGAGGAVLGHYGRDAFDGNLHTYWESIGNALPNADYSFEWVECAVGKRSVSDVVFWPWAGNYVVYVSIAVDGVWQGSATIPYNQSDPVAKNGADIPYVMQTTCGWEAETRVKLPQTYENVTAARITLTNLYDSGVGPYPYRAGIRKVVVQLDQAVSTSAASNPVLAGVDGNPGDANGNYSDYTDIVKWMLGWGGFYWPPNGSPSGREATGYGGIYVQLSDRSTVDMSWTGWQDAVVDGRLWADTENTGTYGPVPIPIGQFDKKPLMDNITYIQDIVGFIFFVDEEGAAVFRSPNIWKQGNFIQDASSNPRKYTSFIPTIDERQVLVDLTAAVSKANSRYRNYVGNVDGKIGQASDGLEPYPVGWMRQGIWTDQYFATQAECTVMADLISVRQLMTFRSDTVTIMGMPALQPDDQVRIFERTTGESYLHYINAITMTFDYEAGEYSMQLKTNWLGERPFDGWFVNPKSLSKDTQDFLRALGKY